MFILRLRHENARQQQGSAGQTVERSTSTAGEAERIAGDSRSGPRCCGRKEVRPKGSTDNRHSLSRPFQEIRLQMSITFIHECLWVVCVRGKRNTRARARAERARRQRAAAARAARASGVEAPAKNAAGHGSRPFLSLPRLCKVPMSRQHAKCSGLIFAHFQ